MHRQISQSRCSRNTCHVLFSTVGPERCTKCRHWACFVYRIGRRSVRLAQVMKNTQHPIHIQLQDEQKWAKVVEVKDEGRLVTMRTDTRDTFMMKTEGVTRWIQLLHKNSHSNWYRICVFSMQSRVIWPVSSLKILIYPTRFSTMPNYSGLFLNTGSMFHRVFLRVDRRLLLMLSNPD